MRPPGPASRAAPETWPGRQRPLVLGRRRNHFAQALAGRTVGITAADAGLQFPGQMSRSSRPRLKSPAPASRAAPDTWPGRNLVGLMAACAGLQFVTWLAALMRSKAAGEGLLFVT